AVLVDFGIARLIEGERMRVTATGAVLGTPSYMAPEQAQGTPVDTRIDIYSLGATLFEMLAGRPPFEGATIMAILAKVLVSDRSEITFPEGCASPGLQEVVLRCLAKDPKERYSSATDLMEALLSTPEGREGPPPQSAAKAPKAGVAARSI